MKKIVCCLLSGAIAVAVQAQITGPDTVFINTPAAFATTANATTYAWSTSPISGVPLLGPTATVPTNSLSVPTAPAMAVDGGNYFAFISNNDGELIRLSFGANPSSSPVATSLGYTGVSAANAQGIDIIKDGSNWYGFIVNANYLIRADFGNALSNTPTFTPMDFASVMQYPQQITILKEGDNWYGFAGCFGTFATIVRFDFGSSLINTPSAHSIGGPAIFNSPANFCLHKEGNNWQMLVSDLINERLCLVNMGPNINNNNPTITILGNPGSMLSLPRSVSLFKDCGNLYGLVMNEDGTLIKLSFPNNVITASSLAGSIGNIATSSGQGTFYPYWYDNKLHLLSTNFNNDEVRNAVVQSLPNNTTNIASYYLPAFTHTFTTPGTYTLSLQKNQGMASGATTYCKTVTVMLPTHVAAIADKQFKIYPVPTQGNINISLEGIYSEAVVVYCIGTNGSVVLEKTFPVSNNKLIASLDLNMLPKGVYNIRLRSGNQSFAKTIVLN